jgi:hypothetical protein
MIDEIKARLKAKDDNPQDFNAHVAFHLHALEDIRWLLECCAGLREQVNIAAMMVGQMQSDWGPDPTPPSENNGS